MSKTKVLLGFAAGAAVGALVGILFAPDEGKKTRKKIAGKAGDLSDSLKTKFDSFVDDLKAVYSNAKEEAEDMEDRAKSAYNSAKSDARNTMAS